MNNIPQDAHSLEVFAIKDDENGKKWAYIGFKISNGNFEFITVPYTEPKKTAKMNNNNNNNNNVDIQYVLNDIKERIPKITLKQGNFADLGNEIGYIIGSIFEYDGTPMVEEEINDFIIGFQHGVSLTNGTHP